VDLVQQATTMLRDARGRRTGDRYQSPF
jgi:hypothetical protein